MRWHYDPGHEWLEVTATAVKGYRPTKYSYWHPETGTVFLEGDVDAAKWGMSTENFPSRPMPEELGHECFREFCKLNGIIRLSQLDEATRESVLDEIQFGQTTSKWTTLSDG